LIFLDGKYLNYASGDYLRISNLGNYYVNIAVNMRDKVHILPAFSKPVVYKSAK